MSLTYGSRRALLTRDKGVGFSLDAFMAGQADGFWYDFSKTDRLFQENTGPTPAAANGDVIGLALDQRTWGGKTPSQVAAAAPNLAPGNGTFDSADGWVLFNGGVISSGKLSVTNSTALLFARAANLLVIGRIYQVTYTIDVFAAGTGVSVRVGDNVGPGRTAAGTYTEVLACTGSTDFYFTTRGASGAQVQIDNLVIKEVNSRPAAQPTTSLKPKLQTTGAAFDGSDDRIQTAYLASVANFIVAKITSPPTIPANSFVTGNLASATNRGIALGIATNGQLRARAGDAAFSTGGDYRNQTVVIGITNDGTTVRVFAGGDQVYNAAQSGLVDTTLPLWIGSLNLDGTPSGFQVGSIQSIVAGRQFLDLDTFKKIAAAL